MEAVVKFDNEDFLCKSFYDAENNIEGIDVYYGEKRVGEILDISIADAEDEESWVEFESKVQEWLEGQDANYLLG